MRYPEAQRRRAARADLLTTALLLGFAGVVSTLAPGRQLALARGLRATALAPFLELHGEFAARVRLAERLQALREERDALAREVISLRQLAGQSRTLREMVGLEELPPGSYLAADLVPGEPRVGESDAFLLRGPGLAEVETPTAVFTGRGLVGVLRATDGLGGRGEFWTHPDFRVSVRTADGEVSGIVRPLRGEGGQPAMLLEGAPYQGEIPPGTELFTTGLTRIHPPGIRVGTVVSVSEVESGWAKSYLVRPAVQPGEADLVLVWRRG